MKKLIKILIVFVVILMVLIAGGFFALAHFVNPNQFKPVLESTIKENTGRILTIDGDLHWSFFPWLNIQIDQMTLSNPPNFSLDEPFLKVQRANIRLKVLPLLLGQVAFNKLIFQNAVLNLAVAPSGENNWQINEAPSTAIKSNTSAVAKKEASSSSSAKSWQRFSFHAIEFRNGTIHWRNQQINREITFSNVNFQAKNVRLKQKFPIKLSLTVHPYELPYRFDLAIQSTCYINFAPQQYRLDTFALKGQAYSTQNVNFKRIPFSLTGNLNLNLIKGLLEITNFSGKVANAAFNATVLGEKITQSPLLKGELKISPFNVRSFFQKIDMPLRLSDKESLKKFSSQFSFQFSPKFLRMTNFKMTIDRTNISGEVDFTKFGNNTLQVSLNSNAINLDHYLPLSIQSKLSTQHDQSSTAKYARSAATKNKVQPSMENTDLFPAWLKNLTMTGQISIQQLRYKKLLFDQPKITFNNEKSGQINASIGTKFYEGDIASQLTLNTSQSVLSLQEQTQLSGVALKGLLQDLTGRLIASGQLQLKHQASARGNSLKKWINNLNGSGAFTVRNGEIYGIDFPRLLQKGLTFLKKHADIIPNVNESTHFSTINATYRIRQGVLYNNDLLLQSPQLTLKGNGQLNFVKQQLNYRVNILQPGKVTIPLILSGPLFNPSIRVDVTKLVQYTVQTQLTKPLNELKKSPQKAGEWLKQKVFSAL